MISKSNGADTAAITVGAAGVFEVEVTENGCSFTDAVTLDVQSLPIFDLGDDQMLCSDEFASLYIYPLPEEAEVTWSTGNVQPSIEVNAPALSSKRTPTSLFSLTSVSGFLSVDAPEPMLRGLCSQRYNLLPERYDLCLSAGCPKCQSAAGVWAPSLV